MKKIKKAQDAPYIITSGKNWLNPNRGSIMWPL